MNRIFAIASTVALLGAGAMANAASCKYDVNEIDLFTKEKLVQTEWQEISSEADNELFTSKMKTNHRATLFVAGVREGDQRFVAVKLDLYNKRAGQPTNADLRDAFFVTKGSPLTITFADGSEIVLHAKKDVRATTRNGIVIDSVDGNQNYITSKITVDYAIEADEIDTLTSKQLTLVSVAADVGRYRFVDDNGQIDFDMSKRKSKKTNKLLACLEEA
jgi:hypothetical protein